MRSVAHVLEAGCRGQPCRRVAATSPTLSAPGASLLLALCLLLTTSAPAIADAVTAGPLIEAREAQRAGEFDRAWSLLCNAIEAGSDEQAAYCQLGRLARETQRLQDLEQFLRQRLRQGRDVSTAEWTLGLTLMWQHDFDSAFAHLERAIVLNPGRLRPYLDLADCHLAAGNNSLVWLDALRERVGHNWAQLTTRAYLLLAAGQPHEADDLLVEALPFQPDSAEIYRLRGRVQIRLGAVGEARHALDRAYALAAPGVGAVDEQEICTQTSIRIALERASVEEQVGQYDAALDWLGQAREQASRLMDRALEARALAREGTIHAQRSELEIARDRLREATYWSRRTEDALARRLTLLGQADLDMARFDTQLAMERLRAILTRAAETGDERGIEAALYRLGNATQARGEYLESLPYFAEASDRAEQAGTTLIQQSALVGAAHTRAMLAEYRKSLELANLAITLAERIAFPLGRCRAHLAAGLACFRLGLFDRSESHLNEALDLAERHGFGRQQGRAYLRLGLVFDALGQFELAQDWYRQALDLAAQLSDRALEVDCETQIAQGIFELGDYDEALTRFERALELATEAGYLEGRWSNLSHTGEVHKYLGDHSRAVSYFREALRLSTKTGNRLSEASNLRHLGEVFSIFGDYRRSLNYLQRSLSTSRETGSVIGEGEALLSICRTHNASDSFASARDRCSEALTLAERHGNVAWRAQVAVEMGHALLGMQVPNQAEPYFQTARELAVQLRRPALKWPAEDGLSRAFADQGATGLATDMARQAVETLEHLRSGLDRPEKRAGFLEDRLQPYEQLVTLLIEQGLLAEAFQVMEYSRSRAFLELLSNDAATADNAELAQLRNQEMALGREIAFTMEQLAALPATADRDAAGGEVLQTLHELRSRLDEIRQLIGPRTPTAEILTGAQPLELHEVQALLGEDEAIVEYYITRRDLITFLITRDQVRARMTRESEPHLAARVKLLRATISAPDGRRRSGPDWIQPAIGLHGVLLGGVRDDPILVDKTELIIIPHKFLHYVPFHALIDREGTGAHFLVEDFVVSYAPSASVLAHCYSRDQGRRESALALANPAPRDLHGRTIPYVAEEMIAVRYAFGARAQVRIGKEATETVAKTEAAGNHVLHFATHYDIDERDPLRSALDLTPTELDDGRFEVREVMEMNLDANLVVLSGCFTASGGGLVNEMPGSDDWVSLTRAFIYAGAPSVVATLWPVNDRSTASFMTRFYELLPFHTKGETVSLAQRELLAGLAGDSEYRDPYYWAPFVLVGSAR